MRVVSISDYAITHRIGRSENSGTTYTTRFGNVRHKSVFKEFYQTKMGEFSPKSWVEAVFEIVLTLQEEKMLEDIKEYVRNNCFWLKTEADIEEYSLECLASGAYMYWKDFKYKRIPEHEVFVFEGGDL